MLVEINETHLGASIDAREDGDPDELDIEEYDLLAQAIKSIPGANSPCGTSFVVDGIIFDAATPEDFSLALDLVDAFDGKRYDAIRKRLPLILDFKGQ